MSEIRRLCEFVTRLLVAVPVVLVLAHAQAHAAAQPPEQAEPPEPVTAVPPEPLVITEVPPEPATAVPPAEPLELVTAVPPEGVPVMFRGRELGRVYRAVGLMSAEERARAAEERIASLVEDPTITPEDLRLVHGETTSEIFVDDRVVGVISGADAEVLSISREQYADQILEMLRDTMLQTREEFSTRSLLIGLGTIVVVTLVFGGILFLLSWGNRLAVRRLRIWTDPNRAGEALRTVNKITSGRLPDTLETSIRLTRLGLATVFSLLWVEAVMNALPWTAPYSRVVRRYAMEPVSLVWTSFIDFLPDLFFLLVITIVTRLVLRAVRLVFRGAETGAIRFGDFPPEWAEPTYKMTRVLVLALAVVAAFPYIPGSSSPAFQGISLFLGLLVSLSSSSAISNVIAGTVLTYTRAFKLDDVVKIGQTVSRVINKTLLVTDLRTIENVSVSIPNSVVLNSEILNYSKLATDRGLVLHTEITIGYDVPWRQVRDLLLAAAGKVSTVLPDPSPFVHQKALNDFYVTYRLNVVVGDPAVMLTTYSELHAAILDEFNTAGVEIMSPHYQALRDGAEMTVPGAQPGEAQETASFRIQMGGAPSARSAKS